MDFEFSADQEMLRDSVRRYLAEKAPLTWVRSVYGTDETVDTVWRGLAELGVVGLLAPEAHGGVGMGMTDACVVLEELGRAVYPGPYVASAIGALSAIALAGSTDDQAALLPALAAGETIGTVAVYEPDRRYDITAPRVQVAGDRLTGTKVHVLDAPVADCFVVSADAGGELALFVVERTSEGVTVEPHPSVDGSRPEGTLILRDAPARRLAGASATDSLERTIDRMTTAITVDGVGAATRALELAVEYAKERQQFGAPIGSFQAVQHLCADMLRATELARAAAYYACWADDGAEPFERHRAATLAKAYASDELYKVGASAIQVFGGIGFTWEHDSHLYYKRLLTLQHALGGSSEHLAHLADLVF
ncbi:MAG: acyl-CoA dehydrogenase family protein [Acidimicrobiia bacterium]